MKVAFCLHSYPLCFACVLAITQHGARVGLLLCSREARLTLAKLKTCLCSVVNNDASSLNP